MLSELVSSVNAVCSVTPTTTAVTIVVVTVAVEDTTVAATVVAMIGTAARTVATTATVTRTVMHLPVATALVRLVVAERRIVGLARLPLVATMSRRLVRPGTTMRHAMIGVLLEATTMTGGAMTIGAVAATTMNVPLVETVDGRAEVDSV